jgi:hypothetical protein
MLFFGTSSSGAKIIALHGIVGAALGVFLLHLVTMAVYRLEFHHEHPTLISIWHFFMYRIQRAFTSEMLLMTLIFAAQPVYVRTNGGAHYFLRTGNATRELDVQEALLHVSQRWPTW